MASNLSVPELFKYDWRVIKFIEKYKNKEKFELTTKQKVNLLFDEDIYKILLRKKQNEYRNLKFQDSKIKNKTYTLPNFQKTVEFGGKEKGKMAAGIDAELKTANSINDQIQDINGKTGKKTIIVNINGKKYNVSKRPINRLLKELNILREGYSDGKKIEFNSEQKIGRAHV